MKVYFLKTFAVIVGAPKRDYEIEHKTELYTNEERAQRMTDWWKFDQGRRDTEIIEYYVECPVVNDCPIIPDNIRRGA